VHYSVAVSLSRPKLVWHVFGVPVCRYSAGPLAHGNKEIAVGPTGRAPQNLDKLATQAQEMIVLLGYLASLFSTFVIGAAMLSVILTVTAANKAPGHPYRSHVAHEQT
jgi:hypothetical protein